MDFVDGILWVGELAPGKFLLDPVVCPCVGKPWKQGCARKLVL